MEPHLIEFKTTPQFDEAASGQDALWNCYEILVDEFGDEIIASIAYDRISDRLYDGVLENQITFGQWVLHTALIIDGQISNGGTFQLLQNFPQLTKDFSEVLEFLELHEFRELLLLAAGDLPKQMEQIKSSANANARDDIRWYYNEEAGDIIDEHFTLLFDDAVGPEYRGKVPLNGYADKLGNRTHEYVKKNLNQFLVVSAINKEF
ncbi:MAG: hypothetical protein AAGK33_04455 [Pseudomonadota bacterium]